MKNGQWQKVKEIFDNALQHKPEDRLKYVTETCDDDKDLADEIDLFSDSRVPQLSQNIIAVRSVACKHPSRVGRY